MNNLPLTEKRYLRYDFKATEVHDMSMELAAKTQELQRKEEEKKAAMSQFKYQIDMISATTSSLAEKIANGYEMRTVDCNIKYHFPEQNHKQITRLDTDETFVEKMTSDEWNLFSQYQEELAQ